MSAIILELKFPVKLKKNSAQFIQIVRIIKLFRNDVRSSVRCSLIAINFEFCSSFVCFIQSLIRNQLMDVVENIGQLFCMNEDFGRKNAALNVIMIE